MAKKGSTVEGRRLLVGTALTCGSLALFFWWGFHFRLFGSQITFSALQIGFAGWLVPSLFGFGYAFGGWRAGIKVAGGFSLVMCAAVGIGFARGLYHW